MSSSAAARSKAILIGDTFPNFQAMTTKGEIDLHEYLGDDWGLLCSHPADFTPVCTTELGTCAKLDGEGEFSKRGTKMLCISVDPLESHEGWMKDVEVATGHAITFPMICDPDGSISGKLGMLHGDRHYETGLPTTVRSVFIIAPDKTLKLSINYPATTGRNFDEILRVLDSVQLTYDKSLATPAGWQVGTECMVLPAVSAEDAKKRFPEHKTVEVPSGKNYMRFTPTKDL